MRKGMPFLLAVVLFGACDVFQDRDRRPNTQLSDSAFIEVYADLFRARTEEDRQAVLEQHGTSPEELKAFVRAYSRNLPALSAVFDSIAERTGSEPERRILREQPPALPRQ